MNEAEKILLREKDNTIHCITNLEYDIKQKQETVKKHKKHLQEIIDALMCLESEK